MKRVIPGLERLLADPEKYLRGNTLGLVVNQTSLTSDGCPSITQFRDIDRFNLNALFAPEHGLYGVDQDMAHIADVNLQQLEPSVAAGPSRVPPSLCFTLCNCLPRRRLRAKGAHSARCGPT